jgi:serine/threonine protein kinase
MESFLCAQGFIRIMTQYISIYVLLAFLLLLVPGCCSQDVEELTFEAFKQRYAFDHTKPIGKGQLSNVYRGIKLRDRVFGDDSALRKSPETFKDLFVIPIAIKVVELGRKIPLDYVMGEITAHRRLKDHAHIVRLMSFAVETSGKKRMPKKVLMAQEMMLEGSLFTAINSGITEPKLKDLVDWKNKCQHSSVKGEKKWRLSVQSSRMELGSLDLPEASMYNCELDQMDSDESKGRHGKNSEYDSEESMMADSEISPLPHGGFQAAVEPGAGTHTIGSVRPLQLDRISSGADLVESLAGLKLSLLGRILGHILLGLEHMHAAGYVHKDIKHENILISAPWVESVADLDFESLLHAEYRISHLGFATYVKNGKTENSWGSIEYMSPQLLMASSDPETHLMRVFPHGTAADIWAVGVIAYEFWTHSNFIIGPLFKDALWNQRPYEERVDGPAVRRDLSERLQNLVSSGGLTHALAGLPEEVRQFVLSCLQIDEESRPTASELMNLPFIAEALSGEKHGVSFCTIS